MATRTTTADMILRISIGLLAALVIWQFSGLLLLIFAAVLIAIMLLAIAAQIQKVVRIGPHWALALACLVILIVATSFFLLLGQQLLGEWTRLSEEIPKLLVDVGNRLGIDRLDRRVIAWAQGLAGHDGMMGRITATTSVVVSGVADMLLAVVAGLYFAVSPTTYREGVLRLVPKRWRDDIAHFMETAGHTLTLWLAGQLASMIAVGVLFGLGLVILGIPSAVALGFIAAVAGFVPYAGPIIGAVPALLIALSMGREDVIGVLALYLAVQALEGNVITPLIQRRAVDLSPVLTLFAIVAFGGLFGFIGVLLATPLTVIGYIAVKQFYLRNTLKQHATIPGEIQDPR